MTQENETQNPTRMAIVTKDGITLKEVQQYLPSNYGAFRRPEGRIQITGRDDKGWTMDGYVLPRLASGLIPAREFTSMEDEANKQEAEQERIGNLFAECVDDLYKCKEALELLDEKFEQIRCQEESMAQEIKRAKEIDCCPECRICQGETVYTGTLGSSLFYCCRHCGIETFKTTPEKN